MTAIESKSPELVILVNESNEAIGVAEKLVAHQKNLLHRAFSVFIFRQSRAGLELLLQQRALHKYHSPGLWTNTCCSHPRPDESILESSKRRLKEELGFEAKLKDLGWFKYNAHFNNGLSEHEVDHVLIGMVPRDIDIKINDAEVHAIRWIAMADLEQDLELFPDKYTPWFKEALIIAQRHI